MAQVDVSELLVDPDFVDPIQLVTRRDQVDYLGENYLEETVLNSFGSIQPASGKTISRLPEMLRVANVSSFWFKGDIVVTSDTKYPSILVFKGRRYQVQIVFDWSNWGAGWTEGTCVAERPA